jgi:cobaltochelatase CobT
VPPSFQSAQEKLVSGLAPGVRVIWGPGPPRADLQQRVIHLPRLEREMRGEPFELLRGYVDHEVAHLRPLVARRGDVDHVGILRMDHDARDRVRPLESHVGPGVSPPVFEILNALEDGRITLLMGARYLGARANLRRSMEWSLARLREHGGLGPRAVATLALVLLAEGRGEVEAFAQLGADTEVRERIEAVRDLLPRVSKLGSTGEACELAHEIHARWSAADRADERDGGTAAGKPDRARTPASPEASAEPPPGEPDPSEHSTPQGEEDVSGSGEVPAEAHAGALPASPATSPASALDLGALLARALEDLLVPLPTPGARGDLTYVARTDEDEVRRVSRAPHPATRQHLHRTQRASGHLARRLRLELVGRGPVWRPHQRRGRLDPLRLARVAVDDDRIFRARRPAERVDAALTLLLDFSGSMRRRRMDIAIQVTMALSQACDEVGVPCEVLGFTTNPVADPRTCLGGDERNPPPGEWGRVVRWVPLLHLVLQEHGEPFAFARHAFARALQESPRRWNLDGEAVRWAAGRLALRTERDRLLMVLSDGWPNGASTHPGHQESLQQDLRRALRAVERAGITCFGLGIQSPAVEHLYREHAVVWRLEDLIAAGHSVLDRFLRRARVHGS